MPPSNRSQIPSTTNPSHTSTPLSKIYSPPSSSLPVCSTCSHPFSPPSPSSFPPNSLLSCRKCPAYVKPSAFDHHYRLTHSPNNSSFHTCPACLPSLTNPVSQFTQTSPPKSTSLRMFDTQQTSRKLPTDTAAFAAAAAAAQAAASHQMSSAHHHHLSTNPSTTPSSQFSLTVPLPSDPTHHSFSAPPSHNHLFDRSDHQNHPLNLPQHHHHHHQSHQPSHQHTHAQPLSNTLPSHHHRIPLSKSQSLAQVPHQQRKPKRPTTSAPPASISQHPSSTMNNPTDHSHHHTVAMVAHDPHTFARLAAPPPVNVPQPADNRNGSPLRNDSLYPHITARPPHPHHHNQPHQSIPSSLPNQPDHHIPIQPHSAPQHHHPSMRNVPPSFHPNQLAEARVHTATRLSFEEDTRRRVARVANPQSTSHQNPAVMLQFSDNYMTQHQQDAINDTRQRVINIPEPVPHQRDAQSRFDGDPTGLVPPGITYNDIKDGDIDQKRMVPNGSTPAETLLASAAMDPSAIHRQPNLINARSAPRVGPDGRPITPSAFIHGTIEKRVACESCGLLFGDVGSLKRHAARSHRTGTGKGPVYCPQCNASLKNEQNLRRHIAVCHSGDQENQCDKCNASFSSRGSLRIHQQQVHNVPAGSKGGRSTRGGRGGGRGGRVSGINKSSKSDKSYVCDICTDTFKWKGNLKRHRELRHLHLRPFHCQICKASFGTKSNMRVHLITHNNAQTK